MTQRSPFRYFKTSPEIIRFAVMFYFRYPLSLRNVEDLLHERGIEISHETVRFWWNRFGPIFAADIRRKRVDRMGSLPNWRWHLDEVFVKINGVTHDICRAVDHEGELLESYVTKRSDHKAALRFLRKSMQRQGQPKAIVTDKLRSCGAGLKDLGMPDDRETGRWLNNRAENSLRGPSVPTCPSDDETALCFAFAGCGRYRSSPLSTHPSTTTSTRSPGAHADTTSRPAAPPSSPSGVNSVRPNAARVWANRDWFAFV